MKEKFTTEQLKALFGDRMPIQAANMLSDDKSFDLINFYNLARDWNQKNAWYDVNWRNVFLSVHDKMRESGESKEMGARWFSEQVMALIGQKPNAQRDEGDNA